ncbi:alpha/beta hydrolase [Sphingomonas hengshuiensis]|uniref:alpha/beta hydrolase n=1 Tax=Sphingomonas hengshuiensis TaxID=1609977 RepID=UPI0006971E87|nr:alpha/beta hydrolase-fold protein [Sphingomonas hengshuiensis]
MRRPLPCLAALAVALGVAVPATAQQAASPQAYTLPDTQVFDLAARDDGQVYRIFVSVPTQAPPAEGFPTLYVLDGNAYFPGFAGERRIEEFAKQAGGGMLIVGIGYPTDQAYDVLRRRYDLTPVWPEKLPAGQAGGNEHFAKFLLDQLIPEIARRYRVAPERKSLFGHSFGGLFALHMLYTRPTAFEAIIAASPSIWWGDQSLLTEERAFAVRLASGKVAGRVSRLLLLTGERDDAATITWDSEALLQRLQPLSAYGLRTRFAKFEGETHITVPYRAITPTLRFALGVP